MPGLMAQRGKRMDGWTNGRTEKQKDRQKISPFYKTLSPIGAAALLPPKKTKEKVEQGKGTTDHLMPLGYLLFHPNKPGVLQQLVNCLFKASPLSWLIQNL